jgi:hypothetical protein
MGLPSGKICEWFAPLNSVLERGHAMENLNFTKEQLIDIKYFAQELKDNAQVAYYSHDEHDKFWHDKEALSYLRKLVDLYKGVELWAAYITAVPPSLNVSKLSAAMKT